MQGKDSRLDMTKHLFERNLSVEHELKSREEEQRVVVITDLLNIMDRDIDRLQSVLAELINTLDPVLGPEDNVLGGRKEDLASVSGVGQTLVQLTSRIRMMTAEIMVLAGRVDLHNGTEKHREK